MGRACVKCGEVKELTEFHRRGAGYRSDCKVCANARAAKHMKANREKNRQYAKQWRKDNPDKVKAANRDYVERNRKRLNKYNKRWQDKNREKVRAQQKAWRDNNPDKRAEKRARRRAQEQKATPSWYESEKTDILQVYTDAKLARESGISCHVDHIIPLTHDRVCGLHTLANLQILTAEQNVSKGNSFASD